MHQLIASREEGEGKFMSNGSDNLTVSVNESKLLLRKREGGKQKIK